MREPATQYASSLALILGGVALFLPQVSPYLSRVYLNFLLFGAILGFIWPERSWQWGLWLVIPALILTFVNLFQTQNMNTLIEGAMIVGPGLVTGCTAAWLVARFSPRRLPFN